MKGVLKLKVISGTAKGTKLVTINSKKIRPTENRVKEAMFSILHFQLPNSIVLDLFAGSGQLAIEALSRGAAFCTCVDNSHYAHKIQVNNFKKAKLLNNADLVLCDSIKFIKQIDKTFDFIFLDPPYGSNLLIESLTEAQKKLNPSGKIVCEHETSLNMPTNFYNVKLQKQYSYGKISLTVYINNINDKIQIY